MFRLTKRLFTIAFSATIGVGLCAGIANAQGSRKDDIVFNAQGRPMPGSTVRICTSTATGQPCTPLASVYSDAALTQALANPFTTDGLGNYNFYSAPGRYMIELSGPGITTKQIPNVILPSDPSSPIFTSVTTTSGISAFSLSLSGNLTVSGSTAVTGALTAGGMTSAGPNTLNGTGILDGICLVDGVKNATMAAAVTCAGSNGVIAIPMFAVPTLTGNVTIPEGVSLWFMGSSPGMINTTGFTLTINGPIVAPVAQIFTGSGTVSPGTTVGKHLQQVYPQWWGAVGDGVANDTVPIQTAITFVEAARGTYTPGVGGVLVRAVPLVFSAGTYLVTPSLNFTSSHHLIGNDAVILSSGAGTIFSWTNPTKAVIEGLQFQGGTNAILTTESNIDATNMTIDRCVFQGQTDYPIKTSSAATSTPKTLVVINSKFLNTAGGVFTSNNQTTMEHNWFESITTNPVLYNDGQTHFRFNRGIPGTSSPAYWIVTASQAWIEDNIFSGENNQNTALVHIVNDASFTPNLTHINHNQIFTTTGYNIVIDYFPINIQIEGNWFGKNGGYVVNDNYVGTVPANTTDMLYATSVNTFKDNQLGNSQGGARIFQNGGQYFKVDQGGLARGTSTSESPTVDVANNFTNLFPGTSEATASWGVGGTTRTDNFAVAPDGTTTATRFVGTTGGTNVSPNINAAALTNTGNYTASLYVRNLTGANSVFVRDDTNAKIVALTTLNEVTTNEWTRIALPFYFNNANTYTIRISMAAGSELHFWGVQINPGFHASPYLYRSNAAKALTLPEVGVEKPQFYGTAAPVAGDWKVGSIVWNSAPAIGTPPGWVNTTAGAPGTWTALPNLPIIGSTAMPTGALGAGACSTTVTTATTGVTTSHRILWDLASSPSGVTGYGSSPVVIHAWPTAGNVNFMQCATSAVTPAAMTVNWIVQ
jgi:hypothetical protein